MNPREPMGRRKFLTISAGAVGLAAITACSPSLGGDDDAASTADPDALSTEPDRYKDVKLVVLAQSGTAYQPALEAWAKTFNEQTQGTVVFDWTPWESMLPKAQTAIAAPGSVDVFLSDIEFQYSLYENLLEITPWIEKTNYDTAGWFNSVAEYGAGVDGVAGSRYGLPLTAATPITLYAVDAAGDAPTSWEDFDAFIKDNTGGGRYGLAYSGIAAATVKNFLPRFRSNGGVILSADWQPLINDDAGVAALEQMVAQSKYAPTGYLSWDDAAAAQAFLNGDAAVLETWSSFVMPKLVDGDSKIGSTWAVAPLPTNPAGHFTQHNAIIFESSKNTDAAFEFIAMVTGPEKAVDLMLDYKEDSARTTAWSDEAVVESRPYLPALSPALDVAKPFARGYSGWLELFIALGEGVQAALAGKKSPSEALDDASEAWAAVLAKSTPSFEYTE